jgi:hypothetical protein
MTVLKAVPALADTRAAIEQMRAAAAAVGRGGCARLRLVTA